MPETISNLLDNLYEGVRDGGVTREHFANFVLRIADLLVTAKVRTAVIDHETAQILIHAKNLPRA